jgi:hypothetical protein
MNWPGPLIERTAAPTAPQRGPSMGESGRGARRLKSADARLWALERAAPYIASDATRAAYREVSEIFCSRPQSIDTGELVHSDRVCERSCADPVDIVAVVDEPAGSFDGLPSGVSMTNAL